MRCDRTVPGQVSTQGVDELNALTEAKPREDWATRVDVAIPSFGSENHVGIGRRHGLIRTRALTGAAARDGARARGFPRPRGNTARDVWDDTGY